MFVKKKRCDRIKERGCVNGRKQRLAINTDKVGDLIMATEALVITCIIDAMEHQDVAMVDIPGVFVQANMEVEDVNMKFEGELVNLLVKLDPKLYRKCIIDKGLNFLFMYS